MTEKLKPKLRFPEFEGEWKKERFGKISKINPKVASIPNQFVYIDLESVVDGRLVLENTINKEGAPSRAVRTLSKNDILFQTVRPYQMNNYLFEKENGNYVASTGYAQIRTDNNSTFIYQYLHFNKFNKKVLLKCTGTSYPAINSSDLGDIFVSIPSLPEQQKIANYLLSIDQKINLLAEKKTGLSRYKKAMMQQLFLQQIRFKDENGNDYPDWEEKRLGEVFKSFNGLTGKTKENFGFGVPYIKYTQVFNDSKIDISKFDFVEILEDDKQNSVQFGDAFFTVSSETPHEVGMSSILLEDVGEVYLNSFCFGIRPIKDELNPYYYRYFFRSKGFRKEVVKLAQGSTRYNMSKVEFMKINIQIPYRDEQNKIAIFLSAIDESINKVNEQIIQTKSFKKAMLQQMFV